MKSLKGNAFDRRRFVSIMAAQFDKKFRNGPKGYSFPGSVVL